MSTPITPPKYNINQILYFNTLGEFNKVIISSIRKNSQQESECLKPNYNPFHPNPNGWEYLLFHVEEDNQLVWYGWCNEYELFNREEFTSKYGSDPERVYIQAAEVTPENK
jgi:hypothetical protein